MIRFTNNFVFSHVQGRGSGGIDQQVASLEVLEIDHIGGTFYDGAKFAVRVLQFQLHSPPLEFCRSARGKDSECRKILDSLTHLLNIQDRPGGR